MTPNPGQAVSPSPFGALAGPDSGASEQQQQMQDLMGQLRDVADQVNQVFGANPAIAQFGQQINGIIKQAIVAAAKTAPAQDTSSAEAVPPGPA